MTAGAPDGSPARAPAAAALVGRAPAGPGRSRLAAVPRSASTEDFRTALRRHAAGVAVVTLIAERRPVGFTATSVASVSLHPPLVSFNVARAASSWPAVRTAAHFAVNVLAADQEWLARRFATSGIDRFAGTNWAAVEPGVPLLTDALAWLVCRIERRLSAGDHTLVLGHVLDATAGTGEPLVYHNGRYAGRPARPSSAEASPTPAERGGEAEAQELLVGE